MKKLLFVVALLLTGCPPLASYDTHKTLATAYSADAPKKCQKVKKLSVRYFFPDCGGGVSAWVSECEDGKAYVFVCREKCFPVYEVAK